MVESVTIKLSDFSKFPSGRDDNDGDYNGRRYRETILAPAILEAIRTGGRICISLDGVLSFGSSFLEEAFGGLVRHGIASKKDILTVLDIDSGIPSYDRYRNIIFEHIKSAKR